MVAVPSIGRASQVTPRRAAPEADATRDLYERYARQIFAYCLHQLGNKEEAEDAMQSTFLNAFRGFKRGVDPEFESAWLYKIAQNVCLTRQRSSTRRRRVESPGDIDAMQDVLPAHAADSDELIGLPEALEGMPEQQRRALLLREWQGLSYKEIAEELDLSQAAVETLLFRARRSLAAGLTEPTAGKSTLQKLRAGGDAGSLLALLQGLFFSGGAKVAITVATVAAGSVVAATPQARHMVEQAARVAPPTHVAPRVHVAPHHLAAAPASAANRSGSVAPATVAASHASVGAAPVRSAKTTAVLARRRAAHEAALALRFSRTVGRAARQAPEAAAATPKAAVAPAAVEVSAPQPVAPQPVAPQPVAPQPAPTPQPAASEPVAYTPAAPATPSAPADRPKGWDKGAGKDNGNGNGRNKTPDQPASPPSPASTPPAAPAPAPPAPAPAQAAADPKSAQRDQHDGRKGGHDARRDLKPSSTPPPAPPAPSVSNMQAAPSVTPPAAPTVATTTTTTTTTTATTTPTVPTTMPAASATAPPAPAAAPANPGYDHGHDHQRRDQGDRPSGKGK